MGRWTRGSKKKRALRNLILPRPASHENTPTIIYNPEATDLSQVMSYLSPSLTRSSTRCPRFFNFLDFYNTSPISLFHVFPFFFFVFFFFSFFPFFFLFFFFSSFETMLLKNSREYSHLYVHSRYLVYSFLSFLGIYWSQVFV